MSLFSRPSVVCAIIFGCFAVLIPRIFLPFFRPRPSHHVDDHFRRPPLSMPRNDHNEIIEPTSGFPSQMQGAHPNMRMQPAGVNNQEQSLADPSSSKSAVTFALPMYTVGIAVFFIYTCFKYWTKRNSQENELKLRYSTDNIQWNAQKNKFKYQMNNRHNENDDDEEDLYAGLDADYVEYLKLKKRKELEADQAMITEQSQMHHTLDEMKNSLTFISSKLGATKTNHTLTNNEIVQLQDRLASTEAQMYKILSALDAASTKMNEITKNTTRESLEQQTHQPFNHEEEYHLSSRSASESEGSLNEEEENSNSDENSFQQEEQVLFNNKADQKEESSSSYEEEDDDDEVPHEIEHDDNNNNNDDGSESSSSDRYGIMNTNYGCDPTTIDDYELDSIKNTNETSDSQTKVEEWHQRNHSQSLGSSNSSIDKDQSIPMEEQNHLTRRKNLE